MIKKTLISCAYCQKKSNKKTAEINRQLKKGRTNFFCDGHCAAKFNNAIRPDKKVLITKICPHCLKHFDTMTGAKSATYCSRSCASAASVTEHRRNAQSDAGKKHSANLITTAETLQLRESWKYKNVKNFLDFQKEEYQFEYPLENRVFDLALIKKKLFIEFDAKYHQGKKQIKDDLKKEALAREYGWSLKRIKTPSNALIDPSLLYPLL